MERPQKAGLILESLEHKINPYRKHRDFVIYSFVPGISVGAGRFSGIVSFNLSGDKR